MFSALTIKDFLKKTSSNSPVPGGGSIAALSAAGAASLTEMVANLTIGREKYKIVEDEMKTIAEKAAQLRKKLIQDIDNDADAYDQVMTAYKLPKNSPEEKKARNKSIQYALKKACEVPLGVAKDAFDLMGLAVIVIEKGNKNAITDGAVAAMTARTAVLSALYNVKINLASINDKNYVNTVNAQVRKLEKEAIQKENKIILKIEI